MPQTASPDILPATRREESTASIATELAPKPAKLETPKAPASAPYDMLSETIAQAQEVAQKTALQIAEQRASTAQNLLALQHTLLGMAHANLSASFAAAQKIVASTSVNEALALHRHYAQNQVATLTEQASTLRSAAMKLAGDSTEPWADYWTKSIEHVRKSFAK